MLGSSYFTPVTQHCSKRNGPSIMGHCLLQGNSVEGGLTLEGLMVTPSTNSILCPHSVFMCFVWVSEQTTITPLHKVKGLVFITDT
jgi:hypothetical protein